MQNTVAFTLPSTQKQISFTVNKKNRPFSNNFVLMGIKRFVRTTNGRDAVSVLVKCTEDSMEPGRIYYCVYTYKGTLLECSTVN
jgi:hypothetical protein